MSLLRVVLYGLITGLVVYAFVGQDLAQIDAQKAQLAAQTISDRHQIAELTAQSAEMQSTIADLRSRWIGNPALWQPSGLPANTVVQTFDVSGTTQDQLIQSLDDANLCGKYKCLVDPALPASTVAWALESDGYLDPNAAYCYSPRTSSYHWRQHTILMPRWSPIPGSVQIDLVQRWNALETAIFIHESGHVKVSDDWLAATNAKAESLPSCAAWSAFWSNPHLYDGLNAEQNAYHARLRADCRPEIRCTPDGWLGW